MKWSDLANGLGKIAPVLGGVIAGPAGASVGSLLSSFLGVENSPDAVNRAMLEPGKAAEIVKFEIENKTKLAEIALEQTKTEIADIQNARLMHKDSIVPAVLTFMLLIICAGLLTCIIFVEIPKASELVLVQSFGAFLSFLGASLAYWHGTSRSSQQKDKLLSKQ